jgi:hypothetical protein
MVSSFDFPANPLIDLFKNPVGNPVDPDPIHVGKLWHRWHRWPLLRCSVGRGRSGPAGHVIATR